LISDYRNISSILCSDDTTPQQQVRKMTAEQQNHLIHHLYVRQVMQIGAVNTPQQLCHTRIPLA
jgi:hypothetical protein